MWVWSLGWEDPLEKEMATHSSILAWETPWTEEPGGLQFMKSQRVRPRWATKENMWSILEKVSCAVEKNVYFAVVWSLSCVWLFVILCTVAHQTPLSMVFSRQKHWSGLSLPALRDLPESGIKPTSPALAGGFFTTEPPMTQQFWIMSLVERDSSKCMVGILLPIHA